MMTREEFNEKRGISTKKKKSKEFLSHFESKNSFEELEEEADGISHSSEHAIKEEKVSYLNETYLFCGTC